jgi:hypothetical protein
MLHSSTIPLSGLGGSRLRSGGQFLLDKFEIHLFPAADSRLSLWESQLQNVSLSPILRDLNL